MTQVSHFSKRLLRWFDQHGRHDLPWQQNKTPYRVWVSEIMLQQTQVDTVIPYYQRFMQRFGEVRDLAAASTDEVLHLWTGLGYYARARNLHACAQAIVDTYQGKFPSEVSELAQLPGIGPSTAAAIASLAFDQAEAILDGNVKRVLSRRYAVSGWPGQARVEKLLWQKARELTPATRNADYTQAIMDLGATLCTRNKPQCHACPVSDDCLAAKTPDPAQFPHKKPKRAKPTKHCQMLMIYNPANEVSLHKRPEQGIWGGLWSLPEIPAQDSALDYVQTHFGEATQGKTHETIKHVFSHYTLMITAVEFKLTRDALKVMENTTQLWYNPDSPRALGLAAPVKKLLHGQAH